MTKIYEAENHLLVCGVYSDPDLHCHSAAHVMISLGGNVEIITKDEKIQCRGILIPAGMAHTANTDKNKMVVFLFDNTTNAANQIKTLKRLTDETVDEIIKAYFYFEESKKLSLDYKRFVDFVYKCIGIKKVENLVRDKRILYALTYIKSNLQGQITCGDVAKHVCLSESRFSHLFKEQVGMTFSAYLVYQRIMKTYTQIINGKSITEAAIEAGFSSSAHFAETNKKLFGLSARMIKKDIIFSKIAEI